jgi:formylglycine-generating enzyme required for sulfatase activity
MFSHYVTFTFYTLIALVACNCGADFPEMVRVPSGFFVMGDVLSIPSRPKHKVRVDAFYMDKYEVTQGAYRELIGENPSDTKRGQRRHFLDVDNTSIGDNYPVTRVSWFNAVRYCNARSVAEGLEQCYDVNTWECDFSRNGYRLPTEAEWEYACRAGTTTKYYYGEDADELILYANYWVEGEMFHDVMADGQEWGKPLPKMILVGQKKPNPWGLHDMLGNIEEWCNDWYQTNYYENSPIRNPRGPETGDSTLKVVRGGSYRDTLSGGMVACGIRNGNYPLGKYSLSGTIGFRCIRTDTSQEQ